MTETEVMTTLKWGTWEELVLGGAVLRHGNNAWDAVATELRSRTLYPFLFTAEVCKAKYEELQKRFCGLNGSWFEELRKHRMAELKRELEKSKDSIGSLESKIESLKTQKREEQPDTKYGSGQTLSPTSVANSVGVDFSGKETSKDGLSAGSFTEEAPTDWSLECQATETKPEQRETTTTTTSAHHHHMFGCVPCGTLKKRRGKRKRRDCSTLKEPNDVGSSADNKAESTGDCDRVVTVGCVIPVDDNNRTDSNENVDLMKILNSVMENENASAFRKRLDSQKKARYRKTIRRHMDFDSVRSKVSDRSIKSIRELYRDLLLLCINAVVFYPKDSSEYKSALLLRDLVTKTFRQSQSQLVSGTESGGGSASVTCEKPPPTPPPEQQPKPPVKPRSVRPGNKNVTENVVPEVVEVEAPEVMTTPVVQKKCKVRTGNGGRSNGRKRPETPAKRRKRARK